VDADTVRPGTTVRAATAGDLDALVGYEIEIARISFGDEAVTDSLTGDRYGNLRSLATSDVPGRSAVAELLLAAALSAARERGVSEVVGKVHMRNVNMRAVYAKLGFAAEHLSMRKAL
jgi:GNAT superfamily N-acetyltransferase